MEEKRREARVRAASVARPQGRRPPEPKAAGSNLAGGVFDGSFEVARPIVVASRISKRRRRLGYYLAGSFLRCKGNEAPQSPADNATLASIARRRCRRNQTQQKTVLFAHWLGKVYEPDDVVIVIDSQREHVLAGIRRRIQIRHLAVFES